MSCQNGCDGVKERLIQLEKLIYNSAYSTPLSGVEFFLPQNRHKLNRVTSYLVYNKITGRELTIEFALLSDKSIKINSNVPLTDYILILS